MNVGALWLARLALYSQHNNLNIFALLMYRSHALLMYRMHVLL